MQPWWSGGKLTIPTTTMGTQDIRLMLCTNTTPTQDPGRARGVKSHRSSWARLSACSAYFGETFLYSILPNRRLVWHCIPVLFHPIHIHRLEATTTSVWFRVSRRGRYTGILVLRQFLKIEQTLSHGYQLSSLLIAKHTSILIDRQPTLPVLIIIIITNCLLISLYICIVFYIIHPLFLSRLSDNHLLGCLINILDMVLSFSSATPSSRPLFLRTHFALSISGLHCSASLIA
jgi:hypothetical protein